MTRISRTFSVDATPSAVLDYLKDFAHAEDWDPGTVECRRLDDGPVTVGSRWHNTSRILGVSTELEYELTELTKSKVVFAGSNDTATTSDSITVVPTGTGSEITYVADIELSGAAKLASPAMKLVFEKIGGETQDNLVEILNRLGKGPGHTPS